MDTAAFGLGAGAGVDGGLPLACDCPSVEVDQSLGPLLIRCGLCTEPYQGEEGSSGPARRRRAGVEKGLSGFGVNGVLGAGLHGAPMERIKTEAGVQVLIMAPGLGVITSSVPELTGLLDCVDDLSLPVEWVLVLPFVATVSWWATSL